MSINEKGEFIREGHIPQTESKAQEKYNPFAAPAEDLSISSTEELTEAKQMAGVVTEREHIQRLLESGDKKLIQHAIEQLENLHRQELAAKDAEIRRLQGVLNRASEILRGENGESEELERIVNDSSHISQQEFEERYQGKAEFVHGIESDYVLGRLTKEEQERNQEEVRGAVQKLRDAFSRGKHAIIVDKGEEQQDMYII